MQGLLRYAIRDIYISYYPEQAIGVAVAGQKVVMSPGQNKRLPKIGSDRKIVLTPEGSKDSQRVKIVVKNKA